MLSNARFALQYADIPQLNESHGHRYLTKDRIGALRVAMKGGILKDQLDRGRLSSNRFLFLV